MNKIKLLYKSFIFDCQDVVEQSSAEQLKPNLTIKEKEKGLMLDVGMQCSCCFANDEDNGLYLTRIDPPR